MASMATRVKQVPPDKDKGRMPPPGPQGGSAPPPPAPQGPPPEAGGAPPPDQLPPDQMNGAPMGAPPAPAPSGPPEKYGAQFLRRIHEDHAALMQDYYEAMQALDNPHVRSVVEKIIENQEETMTVVEEIFQQAYPESQGLDGAMGDEPLDPGMDPGMDPSMDPGMEGDLPPEGAEMGSPPPGMYPDEGGTPPGEGDELAEGTSERMPADGTDEREPPTEEEAIEGMERAKKGKRFHRPSYKSMVWRKWFGGNLGRKSLTVPARKAMKQKTVAKGSFPKLKTKDHGGPREGALGEDGDLAETTDASNPQSILSKALQEPERVVAQEAAGFLKEMSGLYGLEDEHRMNAFHFHKTLSPIAGEGIEGQKDLPAEAGGELPGPDGDGIHPSRKSVGLASAFLKDMAFERAFGEVHRQEALSHATALEEAAAEMEEELTETKEELARGVPGNMEPSQVQPRPVEPGEVDTKSLGGVLARNKVQLQELTDTLARLQQFV